MSDPRRAEPHDGLTLGGVPSADPGPAAVLRQDLSAAGYTVDGVLALLGDVAHGALQREEALPALLATEAVATPAAVLLRLFVLGRDVPRRDLDRVLPATGTTGAVRLGLVEASGAAGYDEVRSRIDLRPYASDDGSWWIASDTGPLAAGGPLRPDHVLGIGGAATMLAQATIRRPVDRLLDLGTGCGIQALHAVGHAQRVVATDLSTRCLRFAAFNATLNAPSGGLELRRGDLLEPVTGDLFDQVVCNPPFVITPRDGASATYTYRDGGRHGDDLLAGLVRGLGSVLAPGGVAQLLGNWEHRRGEDWRERVAGWLQTPQFPGLGSPGLQTSGVELDAWVVQREVQDPAQYAETWLRDGGLPRGPGFDRAYTGWLEDFRRREVEAIGFGMLTLRRPVGERVTLRRLEDQRGALTQPVGPHLADCLAGHDWLAATGGLERDEPLLDARLRVAADVTEERHHRPGEADPAIVVLRQGGGFGRTVRAGTALAALVGACDGELTVGQVVGALAVLLDEPQGDLLRGLLPDVRLLLGDAMLLPER